MLLIVFLALIAKLTSVSGDCDVGNLTQNNFDWDNFTDGSWYPHFHSSNFVQNIFSCVVFSYGSPEQTPMWKTIKGTAKIGILKIPITIGGIITNRKSNGSYEVYLSSVIWSGRYYVMAVDYYRYAILKHCCFDSAETYVYVMFRSKQPDDETVNDAMTDLKEHNIDDSQLVEWPAYPCA